MSLDSLTFRLYHVDNLTGLFDGTLSVVHKSDLSDNPKDYVLYFGSNIPNRRLRAYSNPGIANIVLTPVDTLPHWEPEMPVEQGYLLQPPTPNGFKYKCLSGTKTGTTEPAFPTLSIGSTYNDGASVWMLVGAKHEVTEITLAASAADLDINVPGDPLSLGVELTSGQANKREIHFRINNAVTDIGNNLGYPEISIAINEVVETEVI